MVMANIRPAYNSSLYSILKSLLSQIRTQNSVPASMWYSRCPIASHVGAGLALSAKVLHLLSLLVQLPSHLQELSYCDPLVQLEPCEQGWCMTSRVIAWLLRGALSVACMSLPVGSCCTPCDMLLSRSQVYVQSGEAATSPDGTTI